MKEKLALKYAKHKLSLEEEAIKRCFFRYSDLGNCYSYGTFYIECNDGSSYSQQLSSTELFQFIGEII